MKKFIGMLLLAATSFTSMASSVTITTKIDKILISEDNNLMYVYPTADIDAALAGTNSCHDQTAFGSWGNFLSYRLDRPLSKEYFALINTAFATNKTVDLVSYNQCNELDKTVSLSYLRVHY